VCNQCVNNGHGDQTQQVAQTKMATAEGPASAADITEENGLDSVGNTLEYGAENGVEGRYWCEIDPLPSSSAEDEAGPERINYKPRSRIKVLHASSSSH